MPQSNPVYRPSATVGFFCPYCGRAVVPSARLSYPAEVVGKFAPVYRCGCGKHVGEPVSMVQMSKKGV